MNTLVWCGCAAGAGTAHLHLQRKGEDNEYSAAGGFEGGHFLNVLTKNFQVVINQDKNEIIVFDRLDPAGGQTDLVLIGTIDLNTWKFPITQKGIVVLRGKLGEKN